MGHPENRLCSDTPWPYPSEKQIPPRQRAKAQKTRNALTPRDDNVAVLRVRSWMRRVLKDLRSPAEQFIGGTT
jgi:hypothetical protein